MENPAPAPDAGDAAPVSPDPTPAPAPSAAPVPSAPQTGSPSASPSGPNPTPPAGPLGPDRIRSNLKIAGVVLVLIGAMTLYGAVKASTSPPYSDNQIDSILQNPDLDRKQGGNISVEVLGAEGATVDLRNATGILLISTTTDASGHALVDSPVLDPRVDIQWKNQTWTRKVFAVPSETAVVQIYPATSASTQTAWVQPIHVFGGFDWFVVTLAVLVLLAGIATFMLRAYRFALVVSGLFLLAAGFLLVTAVVVVGVNMQYVLQPLLYTTVAGFSFWAVRKGRHRFQPFKIGSLQI